MKVAKNNEKMCESSEISMSLELEMIEMKYEVS
jgi:hypothetical protein